MSEIEGRQGLTKPLIQLAAARARNLRLLVLEPETQFDMTEDHDTFEQLEFSTDQAWHP
ncbi:hypothetical protein [Tropicibacter sp. Alg240-R139]|uniref:hypothetical protein n=1 Tax=Tropicibacter sp. Alg240-R139 TaxID=2305991 RepID=UPI0013DFA635|nr:hypothetical protein [Tropicibacter sp. Alg240-R139]